MEDEHPYVVVGIVFCPTCSTNQDVEAPDGAEISLRCVCGQTWTMLISEHLLLANGPH